jgi:predicted Zn-dependent protease
MAPSIPSGRTVNCLFAAARRYHFACRIPRIKTNVNAQNPVTGDKNFVLMSEAQEVQLGAQAHKEVLKEYAALDNPALQAYVNEVGRRLAKRKASCA